jgi:putative copper resistance protein D
MPAFGRELSEEQRWDLVNFLRALSSGYAARAMRPTIELDRPWLVAPDFTFTVGPTPPRSLREYRGRRIVLLVLYDLARARPRLAEIAGRDGTLAMLGVEVIAVPVHDARDAIKRIGREPRVLFSIVTEGAEAIVDAYRLFATAPHVELLIDRQGYIRAVTRGNGEAGDLDKTIAEIQRLNDEKAPPPAPEEHVH